MGSQVTRKLAPGSMAMVLQAPRDVGWRRGGAAARNSEQRESPQKAKTMDRKAFIDAACIAGRRVHADDARRGDHERDLKATAEAMADALGLTVASLPSNLENRIEELEKLVTRQGAQIDELEGRLAAGRG